MRCPSGIALGVSDCPVACNDPVNSCHLRVRGESLNLCDHAAQQWALLSMRDTAGHSQAVKEGGICPRWIIHKEIGRGATSGRSYGDGTGAPGCRRSGRQRPGTDRPRPQATGSPMSQSSRCPPDRGQSPPQIGRPRAVAPQNAWSRPAPRRRECQQQSAPRNAPCRPQRQPIAAPENAMAVPIRAASNITDSPPASARWQRQPCRGQRKSRNSVAARTLVRIAAERKSAL